MLGHLQRFSITSALSAYANSCADPPCSQCLDVTGCNVLAEPDLRIVYRERLICRFSARFKANPCEEASCGPQQQLQQYQPLRQALPSTTPTTSTTRLSTPGPSIYDITAIDAEYYGEGGSGTTVTSSTSTS